MLSEDEPALETIARHYLKTSQCPRYMEKEKVDGRHTFVRQLVEDYHAQGVLYEQLKFCEFWGYERALGSYVITHDYGIPSVAIDRQNATGSSGQLRTRVQAFIESLEIKQIQAEKGVR
jgi:benzoyl-CoA reductase/2-hydroxyglutaryl-CoA dehydratase subunit BcrC/BadD/HgdB